MLACAAAVAAADVTVKCSVDAASLAASGCSGTCVTAPPSPAKGANFTITVNGNCPADVTTATYDATGTFAGIPVLKVLGNPGCGDTDFPVGGALNLGHMYIGGVACPVKGGAALVLDNKAFISKLAPPGTLKSSLTTYDQDKKPLFKILLDVTSSLSE